MTSTDAGTAVLEVHGTCDTKFALVREEFENNFHERGEVGAAVHVTIEGEPVVDLWGGVARPDAGAAWQEDTIGIVMSCTKGATALCAHVLASRGLLDLDAPVSRYWPEFAEAGKEHMPVRQLLNHQSGLAHLRAPLPQGAYFDWNLMTGSLAAETPFWEPGTRNGYHMVTFGWLVGEVVRRISGRSVGTFFQEEVAGPLGIDFWIGLPEAMEPRVAPLIPAGPPAAGDPPSPFFAAITEQGSLQSLAVFNAGGYSLVSPIVNSRDAHAAEIPGAGGITNARGLAGMYAPLACGGSLHGRELVDATTLARMGAVSSATGRDAMLLIPTRFALGFMKSMDNRGQAPGFQDSAILSEQAFGHVGAGGSIGFADPTARMSMGYMMNRMGPGILLNPRGQSLVDAVYRSLGYTSNAAGAWR